MPEVREEKTGWRDQRISERHRRWGWDCPALDLDFLMLEYDRGKAVAIVEYKNEHAKPQYRTHPSYQALIDLGNRAGVPVFGVRYTDDWSWWRVTPLNGLAKKWVPKQTPMTEDDWVTTLYRIRGTKVPPALFTDKDVEI